MINAKELRLWNLVSSTRHKGLITEIVGILNLKYVRLGANPLTEYSIDDIEPIPLSPEVLAACGFEQTEHDIDNGSFDLYRRGKFPLWLSNYEPNSAWVVLFDSGDGWTVAYEGFRPQKDFENLHQLQNLYFALTGEELQYSH